MTTTQILGITDDVNECDCCGKVGLKRTVIMQHGPDTNHYGTTCAGRMLGKTGRDVAYVAERRCNNNCGRYATTFYRSGRKVCGECDV